MAHAALPKYWVLRLVVVLGLSGTACEYQPAYRPEGEGPGHRPQRLALSPAQELQLGREAYREILGNPKEYGRVMPVDSPETQRVRRVVQKLIHAAEIEPLQREMNIRRGYRYEWEVNVLDNRQVNAFCLPGGKIGVFRGILAVTQNDDQLATVLAHEIGHALAHHSNERAARGETNRGMTGAFWGKAFDRAQESEADHIGIFLMTFAGYDPREAVRFWERMASASSGQRLPEILSDHPSDDHRIRDIQQQVPRALAAKRAFDEGKIAPEHQP